MMLEYLGWKEAAALIEKALEQSFLDARATHDLARFMREVHPCLPPLSHAKLWKESKSKCTIKNEVL